MRAYPSGSRVESDNMDVAMAWALGVQMVALNYQTEDVGLHISQSKFVDSPGAVQRPAFVNDIHTDYNPDPQTWVQRE